ncbi:putative spermidine/putrescine transport system substrate-binding protein [Bradyrhizobium sp. RT9b]|uniref:ABC transporter substrate-binding protein n=1 Tax=Bradyrhizobium sp. RT9b TaxID=3156385 RepID=UPI00339644F8
MAFLLDRRRFMQSSSSAAAAGALSSIAGSARGQGAGELRVLLGGGDIAKARIAAFVKPFEAETGIKVTPISDEILPGKFELMVTTNNVAVDVLQMDPMSFILFSKKGYFEPIDYSIYKQEELEAVADFAKDEFGMVCLAYSYVMVYNTKTFPPDKPRPSSWAEFWDVKKFPGVRVLNTGANGFGPWEEALLADGVSLDKLYPLDIDRVFASLDKIKPHIRKWHSSGAENQQIMHDLLFDVIDSYDGRAQLLVDKGEPIEINRNQAKLSTSWWAIPKGGPNARNAQKFVEFAMRADRQAAFSQLISYAPTNLNAFKHMPEEIGRKLATHPDYVARSFPLNAKWYAQVGADGQSNMDRLIRRWKEWIFQ